MKIVKNCLLVAFIAVALAQPAAAQSAGQNEGWKVAIYPVLAWIPLGIGIDVNLPPVEGGGGSSGGGKIVDGRFDGAFFGGASAAKGKFRIDASGLWAAVGGDRKENPFLKVDVDATAVHATAGFMVARDFYVTGGVRRMALKYDITLGSRQFSRKPGFWDPLVGVGWHHDVGKNLVLHATVDGGGFGVGSDVDFATSFNLDWKPIPHFGLNLGYNTLYLKFENTVASKTFTVDQSLHGPVLGIGFYF